MTTAITVRATTIEVTCGDLSAQSDVEALCLFVNRWLIPVGAAAQRVHHSARQRLAALCKTLSPVDREEVVVVTEAFDLPNRVLFHCRELVQRRHPMYVAGLSAMYRRVLLATEQQAVHSLALEPLGCAARVEGVWSEAANHHRERRKVRDPLHPLKLLRFVMKEEGMVHSFRTELASSA